MNVGKMSFTVKHVRMKVSSWKDTQQLQDCVVRLGQLICRLGAEEKANVSIVYESEISSVCRMCKMSFKLG